MGADAREQFRRVATAGEGDARRRKKCKRDWRISGDFVGWLRSACDFFSRAQCVGFDFWLVEAAIGDI